MSNIVYRPIVSLPFMIFFSIALFIIILINKKNVLSRSLIIVLLLIISQRPMLKDMKGVTFNMNLDVLFVIDNTVSMNAIDVDGNTRMEAVKKDCLNIINAFSGSRFAVITYSDFAQIRYPFTSDISIIKGVINNLKIIDPNFATGSSFDVPYDYMKMLLESSNSKDKHKRIVFFIGDGEVTAKDFDEKKLEKFESLAELIDSGAVLGYGTKDGAKVKITESVILDQIINEKGYLLDSSTNPPSEAISKLNEKNLELLAEKLNIDYYHMKDYSVINDDIINIKKEAIRDDGIDAKMDKDIYYYFSFALILLLLYELFYYRRNEQ